MGIGIDRFKVAQTVQTLFTLVNQIAAKPGPFHLTHFATQNGIFGGVVPFKTDLTHVETVTCIDIHVQLNGFIRVVDFWLGLNAWVSVTITAEQLFNAVFHFGDFRTAIQFTRLQFGQALDLSRMAGEVTAHFNTRKRIFIAFSNVNGNVDTFLVRSQTHLR